ncbi:MAG TPA: TonB-dependent receptor [Vicinamibacteria bacterium]|nr:TonB-dependent receptor [Vicinamibacteria bacterium]
MHSLVLLAAATLSIQVVDPQQAPVPGAQIQLVRGDGQWQSEVRADAHGAHAFHSIAPGAYLISATSPGFSRKAIPVRLAEGGSERVTLRLDLASLEESVVVTSAASAQTLTEVTKSVSVVDGDEIEIRDEHFIPEALRTIPGLRIEQLGGPGAFTSIKTRGLRTEDTAILVDGARLRDPSAPQGDASSYIEGLIVTDVESLEVLRGSGSSLHGTNAGGGVINIVTAPGGGKPRGSALIEGGGLGLLRANAQTSGGLRDRMLYSLGLAHLNVADGVDGNDNVRNTSVQGRALLQIDPSSSLSFRFYGADVLLDLNESPSVLGSPPPGVVDAVANVNFTPSADDPDSFRQGSFASTLVAYERRPNAVFGFGLRYHGLVSDRRFEDGPLGVSPFEPAGVFLSEFEGDIHTFAARSDFEWGRNQLIHAGYELEHESFKNRTVPEDARDTSLTDVSQASHTFTVQDQLTFVDGALSFAGSLRTQLFSLHEPKFTPAENAPFGDIAFVSPDDAVSADVSGAYALVRSGTRVRAHWGMGYRAPSLFERFGTSFGSFGYSAFGDPRLSPEKTRTFDVGLEQRALSDRLEVTAMFFRTRLSEIIIFDFSGAIDPATDPFGRFGGYRSTDGGVARGLELTGELALTSNVRLRGSYTFTDAEPPTGVSEEQTQAFVIPRHQGSAVITSIFGPLSVSFDLYASGGYLAPVFDNNTFVSRVYRFDGFAKGDLAASYRFSHLRVFGKVENLFDQTIFESGFRTPGRYALVGVGVDF